MILSLLPSVIIVVESFVTIILDALPNKLSSILSKRKPKSSLIKVPCVKIAISSNKYLRKSPKPGALIATTLIIPRNLLRTKVDNASFSISSAIINKGFFVKATFSRIGIKSCWTKVSFLFVIKTKGFSYSTSPFS